MGSQSIMSSSNAQSSGAKTTHGQNYDKKMQAQEDRRLDQIAAEAQAFLLNNQKKTVSDVGSVSSMSKGTVA